MNKVPFNRPFWSENQSRYVEHAMKSGHLSGDGPFTKEVANTLSEVHGGSPVLLTTSCTAALEMCALLLDIQPGDEVIVPSFTFVSSANAFVLAGATIVFVDIDPYTFNIDPSEVEKAITPKTKAVVAVNYGGANAVTPELNWVILKYELILIEDNAHGLFSSSDGRALGTNSALSTLSFHESKNVTCGEGGALVVNDSRFFERAEIIREKGTNRSNFFRGTIDKYTWVDKGSSYLLSDINAAMLKGQLESAHVIQANRRSAFDSYLSQLQDWSNQTGSSLPTHLGSVNSSVHLFPIIVQSLNFRSKLITHCRENGVNLAFHYIPLHSSPAAQKYGCSFSSCPVTTDIASRLVRLPLFSDINSSEIERVLEVVSSFKV